MKKFTAILLLIAMIINTMVFVYADENAPVLQNKLAVETFKSLKIISTDEDIHRYITRIEACRYIAELMHLANVKEVKSHFSDTDDKCVDVLAASGIVKGGGNGLFEPNEVVTNRQLVVMLLRALGYDAYEAHGNPNWYLDAIRRTELDAGFINDNPATLEDLIYLMYDAGLSKLFEAESYREDEVIYGKTAETLFAALWNLYYAEGVVCANMVTSIKSGAELTEGKNQIQIGDAVYDTNNDFAYEYIAQNVNGIYQYDKESGKRAMLCFVVDEEANDALIFEAENVESFKNGVLTYHKNNSVKTLELNKFKVVYNGKAVAGNFESLFPIDYGNVKIYKDGKTGEYANIVISEIKYLRVSSVSYTDTTVYTDGVDGFEKLEVKNDDGCIFTFDDTYGTLPPVTGLKAGEIISVQRSQDGKVIRAVLCNEEVSGKLDAVKTSGGKKLYTIDGKDYVAADVLERYTKNPKIGEVYSYTVDGDSLLAVTDYANTTGNYGYIYAMGKEEKPFDTKLMVKLFTENGVHIIAEISKNARIDNDRKNSLDDIIFVFRHKITGEFVRQLVRYRLNSKGQIIEIDTAASNEESREETGTLWEKASGNMYYSRVEMMFEQGCIPKARVTPVFMVPLKGEGTDEKNFGVVKFAETEPFGDRGPFAIACYKHDESTPYIDAIVYNYSSGTARYGSYPTVMIVEGVETELVGEDVVYKVTGNVSGYTTEFYTEPDCDINGIDCGDAIRFMYGLHGSVSRVGKIYDYPKTYAEWAPEDSGEGKEGLEDEEAEAIQWMEKLNISGVFGDVMSLYRPTNDKRNSLVKVGTLRMVNGKVENNYFYAGFNEEKTNIIIVENCAGDVIVKNGNLDEVEENKGKMLVIRYGNLPKILVYYKDR